MDELERQHRELRRDATDRTIEEMIMQALGGLGASQHAQQTDLYRLKELAATLLASLELAPAAGDHLREYVIHEEPEFVWEEGGSNPEPEAPRPLNPR